MTWAGQAVLTPPGLDVEDHLLQAVTVRVVGGVHSHDHVVGPEFAGDAPKDLVR